jgi:hypothetical protein
VGINSMCFSARTWSVALTWTGVLSLTVTASAAAQVRVAVVPFDGGGASGVRRQVQAALSRDPRVEAVDLDLVESAADRSGAHSSGRDGIPELARELSAQMVIQGVVTGHGRRQRIRLTARDAQGTEIGSSGGAVRGGGIGRAVESLLDEALPQLSATATSSRIASAASTGHRMAVVDEVSDREDEEQAQDTDRDDGYDEGRERPWDMRAPFLSIQLGVVPRSRETDVTFEDPRQTRRYRAWYPELAVRAELRPLARDVGLARAIYGRIQFAHGVGLTSRVDATGQPVDTAFYRLDIGAGALFPLADAFDLGVELGIGWDTYNLADNPLLESAEYVYIRPALRARVRLFREIVILAADIGVRPVLSRGDLNQYGSGGDTIGFDVGGGLGGGYALAGDVGLSYAIELAWVGYWMNFSGRMGADAARSGTDSSLRIGIWVGLAVW